jgi:hypothetical protein
MEKDWVESSVSESLLLGDAEDTRRLGPLLAGGRTVLALHYATRLLPHEPSTTRASMCSRRPAGTKRAANTRHAARPQRSSWRTVGVDPGELVAARRRGFVPAQEPRGSGCSAPPRGGGQRAAEEAAPTRTGAAVTLRRGWRGSLEATRRESRENLTRAICTPTMSPSALRASGGGHCPSPSASRSSLPSSASRDARPPLCASASAPFSASADPHP